MKNLLINHILCGILIYGVSKIEGNDDKKYSADWSDLDTRPLPRWYDEAKIGIFIHWGVYSVPGFGSEWFWNHWKEGSKAIRKFMQNNYRPGFTYQDFAPMFTAEFFDADIWASLFAASGARYVVLTTKHHDGYALFPSKRSFSWNSVYVGPKRDIVGELAAAVRKTYLKFGVYHSLYEWFHPMYNEDKNASFTTQKFPDTKLWPDILQLINDYEPSVLWADGDWDTTDDYWRSTELLSWLYNESPVKDEIVVNDRWGIGSYCNHGDFYNCADAYNPGVLQKHKWENAFPIDSKSWGYRRNILISDIISEAGLLWQVVTTVSCGGNALINIGPTKEGTISPIFQERLLSLGAWLTINGEAIYKTSPWTHQNDSFNHDVWYTCKKTTYNILQPTAPPQDTDIVETVYAIFFSWPSDNILQLKDLKLTENHTVEILDHLGINLKWSIRGSLTEIVLPSKAIVKSNNAWSLRFNFK